MIEQIGILNANANQQRERIAQSIKSGRDLADSINRRAESNKQIIAAIDMQLPSASRCNHRGGRQLQGKRQPPDPGAGHIQFQDVMRQRIEHVQGALVEMRDHLQVMSDRTFDFEWQGDFAHNFKEMLEAHKGKYRMAGQTITHLAASGTACEANIAGPDIELF